MQKKLMAMAVAGALVAPGLALAQTSTVQIYGNMNIEYGIGEQPGRPDVDYMDTPGGSAIGFRGEEKLGGNLSAWFQCETSADIRGVDQIGLCSRNSALGLKGGFGNVYGGRWDTPLKIALNQGTVGANETGLLGMSFLPFGGSGGADATGTGSDAPNRQRWKRREANVLGYESPSWGGFRVLAMVTAGNRAADLPATAADPNPKPRVWSIAGVYTSGPLAVGLGYERHNEFGAHQTGATTSLDDRGWGISAAYTFGGVVKVGATYLDTKYETGVGMSMDKETWTIGVDWTIAGPHSLHAQYAYADDTSGNSTVGLGGNGGVTAPCTALVAGVCTPVAGGTGGDAFSIAYQYAFSKRTRVRFGYVMVDNDSASTSYRIGNTAAFPAGNAGAKVDSFAFHIQHRF
jgi:predicted porin